jgi:hypothetical protein
MQESRPGAWSHLWGCPAQGASTGVAPLAALCVHALNINPSENLVGAQWNAVVLISTEWTRYWFSEAEQSLAIQALLYN